MEHIEREVALELIESAGEWGWSKERLYDEIQDVPSADVTPVVHGHWKWNIEKKKKKQGRFVRNAQKNRIEQATVSCQITAPTAAQKWILKRRVDNGLH